MIITLYSRHAVCEKDIITVAPCMYCRLVVQGNNFITKLCSVCT